MNTELRSSASSKSTLPHNNTSSVRLFSFAPALLLLAFIWPFGGGKDINMMAGQMTPGARCTIHIHQGDNRNSELDLKAESLAAPSSLTPARNAYVVWIQAPDEAPQNHGQMTINSDQKGELKTETPYKRFKVFITAEDQAQLRSPEGPTVLSADVAENQ